MSDLSDLKAAARKAAFARRKAAHGAASDGTAALLSKVLAGHRGVPLAGYMPIRTEIDPLPAMAEAAAHGSVGVPVILGEGQPLKFSRWQPGCAMKDGPFGAQIPQVDDFFEPEIVVVPLVAFDRNG
ncbi:MAG: 5-formyltetrahydrofolate cyclo-ligase, partial [Pseudomonadota bacterium]